MRGWMLVGGVSLKGCTRSGGRKGGGKEARGGGGGRRCSGKKKKMSVFEGDDYLRSWELERRFVGRGLRILIDSEK